MSDLTLICETCNFPIGGDSGCLYAAFAEMRDPQADVRWRTSHYGCFPAGERDHYEISSERISGWRQLAWWTAHLMSKNWLARSDWDDLLRELCGDENPRRIQEAA